MAQRPMYLNVWERTATGEVEEVDEKETDKDVGQVCYSQVFAVLRKKEAHYLELSRTICSERRS